MSNLENEKAAPLILDGAAGTYLEAEGAALHPKLWSSGALLTHEGHESIRKLHRAYIDAGADVITTVTYQASVEGLTAAGLSRSESLELMTQAVLLAREEARKTNRKIIVAAGLGPYGAYLSHGEEYTGKYGDTSYDTLKNFWIPRVECVLAGKPDVLLFETVPNITELEVIVNELTPIAQAQNVPVWIALSLQIPKSPATDVLLADGTPLHAVEKLLRSQNGIHMIGANCFGVHETQRVIENLRQVGLPLIVYPNSGEVYDGEAKTWADPSSPGASGSPQWEPAKWFTRGAAVIGGCCRTTPETIEQVRLGLASGIPF